MYEIGIAAAAVLAGIMTFIIGQAVGLGSLFQRPGAGTAIKGGAQSVMMGGAVTLTRHTAAITALNTLTTVDQTAEGSTDPFQFPSGVTRIVRIIISAVHDYGATNVSLITLTYLRLSGQGVGGGLHEFAGPGSSVAGFGTSTGAFMSQQVMTFETNIMIAANAKPIVQAAIAGDTAPGGTRIQVTFQFA